MGISEVLLLFADNPLMCGRGESVIGKGGIYDELEQLLAEPISKIFPP